MQKIQNMKEREAVMHDFIKSSAQNLYENHNTLCDQLVY